MNWYIIKFANRDNAILQRLKKKWPEISNNAFKQEINYIKQADPTINKQYSDWITKLFTENIVRLPEDTSKLLERLTQFDKLKNSPKFKSQNISNIYQYKTYSDLAKMIDENLGNASNKEQVRVNEEKGIQLIINKPPYKAYKITTEEGASKLCQGTEWCVKDPKYSKDYLQKGPLYLILYNDKKYALIHFESDSYMDVYDKDLPKKIKWECISLLSPYTGINQFSSPEKAEDYIRNIEEIDGIPASVVLGKKELDKLEDIIAKSADASFNYANQWYRKIRFLKGEAAIGKNGYLSLEYAIYVIKGRFPEGEDAIAKSPSQAYQYADFLGERFLKGEPAIQVNPGFWKMYKQQFNI